MTWVVVVVIKTDVALPALTATKKKSFEENPTKPTNQTDRALK
jgi:hypothetical protein